eukprot:CAMPEP_0113524768 /NCGR_PEP_ID=MMETSP0014_2-20120614/46387_1 /TAXON_ID=2857 /ORGANISM="Nitzschia sp." /LENGTH=1563 /DNA_ID=CAMNT_0000422891 /DNA_START=177 /DNA_END=4868 /DNA_ORIENTATION=+ /assembly_acc=CAM_ASM_000159
MQEPENDVSTNEKQQQNDDVAQAAKDGGAGAGAGDDSDNKNREENGGSAASSSAAAGGQDGDVDKNSGGEGGRSSDDAAAIDALLGLDALSDVASKKDDAVDVAAEESPAEPIGGSNDGQDDDAKMSDSGDDDDDDDDEEEENGGTFMNMNGAAGPSDTAGGVGGKSLRREESSGASLGVDDEDDEDITDGDDADGAGGGATAETSGSKIEPYDDNNNTGSQDDGEDSSDPDDEKKAEEANNSGTSGDGDDGGKDGDDGDGDDDYNINDDDDDGADDDDDDDDAMDVDTDKANGGQGAVKEEVVPADKNNDPPPSSSSSSTSPKVQSIKSDSAPTQTTSSTSAVDGKVDPPPAPPAAAGVPGPPVLKGRLFYDLEGRKHFIRGMWNFENADENRKLRFDLSRNLRSDEDPKELPKDGEFHGSFSNRTFIPTKKGGIKEKIGIVNESGVNIKFTKTDGDVTEHGQVYNVDGTGTNPFGTFSLTGKAVPSGNNDDQYTVELRKAYPIVAVPPRGSTGGKSKNKKTNKNLSSVPDVDNDGSPPPPPSQEYKSGVVCQRGTVTQESNDEMSGLGESLVVTRVVGTWAIGLDIILDDPDNETKQQGHFELEHKGSNKTFPVPGRYTGYFMYGEQKITERELTLRFRKNDEGYYNVEGKGSNRTTKGKYTVSGTLKNDGVITMFRMFPAIAKKQKTPKPSSVPHQVTSAPPPINPPGQSRRPSVVAVQADVFTLADVEAPEEGADIKPFDPPENGNYAAVTRGVLREDEDGSLSCSGKWAQTRENLSANGQSSMCNLRLEAHFVQDAKKKLEGNYNGKPSRSFPLDSDQYKGSFELKRLGGRPQKVIDRQIVMKFRETSQGMYNVYGRGINEFGIFNLTGTLVVPGKSGGQIELYRYYPPALLTPQATKKPSKSKKNATAGLSNSTLPPVTSKELAALNASTATFPGRPPQGIGRRESTRTSKVPSRLEDDNPEAQLARNMDKCWQLLKYMEDNDMKVGGFFKVPVDPVALKIPNYYHVISEPMDLETLRRKMDASEVETPEEFCRLMRLIFENAIKFNEDPTHNVHRAARQLLSIFNQRFQSTLGLSNRSGESSGKKGGKNTDKKRKRDAPEVVMTPKLRRMKEAEEMQAENERCVAALVSAAPLSISSDPTTSVPVSRQEFNLMLNMIQKLQQQIVKTHTALADMSSTVPEPSGQGSKKPSTLKSSLDGSSGAAPPPKKKTKKKTEAAPRPVPRAAPAPAPSIISDEPLTQTEQEWLTNQINEMTESESKIHEIVDIIRSSDTFQPEDEEEIDLEIDQLDNQTQRKLLAYAKENVAKAKKQTAKTGRKQARKNSPKKTAVEPSPVAAAAPSYSPKAGTGGGKFFSFGNDGSDSESDGEVNEESTKAAPAQQRSRAGADGGKDFRLGGLGDEDSDEEDDDDDGGGNFANWNIAKLEADTADTGGDEDDAWGAARSEAKAAKAREQDKKKREEKLQAEAEQQKNQRLAEAVAHGEEIKAMRQAEEEEEARLQEEKEREAEEERQKAREDARKAVQSVERTVDLDAERDLMKQLEQNYMGGASPSSDFGF